MDNITFYRKIKEALTLSNGIPCQIITNTTL